MKEIYLAGQAEFEKRVHVGSKVRVVCEAESYSRGWDEFWNVSMMSPMVGREYIVRGYGHDSGVSLVGGYYFPYYVLELVSLPEEKPEHEFKPFDRVLVRDDDDEVWACDFFSHNSGDWFYPYKCAGDSYARCIPFDGNEHLVGTSDNP